MFRRLLILIILTLAAWLPGCQRDDSFESVVPGTASELTEQTETPQPPPAQKEPDTQSPTVSDASETADAAAKETSPSETESREDTVVETPPATESEGHLKVEAAADSGKELPKKTDSSDPAGPENGEKPPTTESDDEHEPNAEADSAKESPKEADLSDPAESETEHEPDFQINAPQLYEACKHIFTTYVDKHGNVDYKNLRRKRAKLIVAARAFDDIDPREYFPWSRNEKIAFWINAYNILTLKLVVENYPIKPLWWKITYPPNSIIQINGAWTKKYFNVMGIQYTLREIERQILMAGFKDPRICFAFSYATLGGALLRNEPYYPDKLGEQLDDQVRKFLAAPRGLRIDHQEKTIRLADIFNWYRNDFIREYGDIKKFRDRPPKIQAYLNFIVQYISPDDLRYFESTDYDVKFLKYDWRLNEQANK